MIVYRAHDTRLDRTVAVKIVHPNAAGKEVSRSRWEQDGR